MGRDEEDVVEDVSLLALEMDRIVDGKALEARSTRSEVEVVRSNILGELCARWKSRG